MNAGLFTLIFADQQDPVFLSENQRFCPRSSAGKTTSQYQSIDTGSGRKVGKDGYHPDVAMQETPVGINQEGAGIKAGQDR